MVPRVLWYASSGTGCPFQSRIKVINNFSLNKNDLIILKAKFYRLLTFKGHT